MLFRKRRKAGGIVSEGRVETAGTQGSPDFYRIPFEMMLKGALIKRRHETVRQYGVTVSGSTRLVTSGDVVDRETYRALLAAGAIRPVTPEGATEDTDMAEPQSPESPASST